VERLWNAVELGQGGWVMFVLASSRRVARTILERLRDRLRDRLRVEGSAGVDMHRSPTPATLRDLLPALLSPSAEEASLVWVEAVHADLPSEAEERGPWLAAWADLLRRCNERRDTLLGHLRGGLVLVGPPQLKQLAQEVALDLWAARDAVVEPPPLSREPRAATTPPDPMNAPIPVAEGLADFARDEARRLAQEARAGGERLSRAFERAARRLLAEERVDEAVALAEEGLEVLGALPDADADAAQEAPLHAVRAEALAAVGDIEGAGEAVGHAIGAFESGGLRVPLAWLDLRGAQAAAAGDLAGAERDFRVSVAQAREDAALATDPVEARRQLPVALGRLGGLLLRRGQQAEAIQVLDEALGRRRRLLRRMHGSLQARRDLSSMLLLAGDAHLQAGDLLRAEVLYAESVALERELRSEAPDDPETLRSLSISLNRAGGAWLEEGESARAAEAFEEALTIRLDLAAEFGETPARMAEVASSLRKVAVAAGPHVDEGHAWQAIERWLEYVSRHLLEAGDRPEDAVDHRWRVDAVLLLLETAAARRLELGDNRRALGLYEAARALTMQGVRRLEEDRPQGPPGRGADPPELWACSRRLADLARGFLDAGDPSTADATAREAVRVLERFAAAASDPAPGMVARVAQPLASVLRALLERPSLEELRARLDALT